MVLDKDFNADNAKIDEALRVVAEPNPYRRIISVVTQSDAQQIDLDISGIDFTQYHKIDLFVDSPGVTSGYILRVNGISANSYSYNANSDSGSGGTYYNSVLASIYGHGTGVVLFYSPAMTARVGCVYLSSDTAAYCGFQTLGPVCWSDLTAFNITGGSSSTLAAGTRI